MAKPKSKKKSKETCRHDWVQTGSRYEPAKRGPIHGEDVYTFTCTKCGLTKEERNSVD
jgi:hypothetical protein